MFPVLKRAQGYLGAIATVTIIATTGAVWAANPVKQHNSNAVWFENWTGLSNATLVVSLPNGEVTTVYAESGTPVFQLSGSDVLDGIYRFELNAATEEQVKATNQLNSGRGDSAKDTHAGSYHSNGHFTVSRGVIITPEAISETDDG